MATEQRTSHTVHDHNPQMQHGGPDPDDSPSSPDTAPIFSELVATRLSRRSVLSGSLATAAVFLAPGAAAAANGNGHALANGHRHRGRRAPLGFASIAADTTDEISLPTGYSSSILIPWGEPILAPFPAWVPDASNSAADQAKQLGMGHDGMHFFPIDGSSEHGLLVLNHEFTIDSQLFVDGTANWDADKTAKSQNAHGVAVVEIQLGTSGWEVVRPSAYNRRVTANTPMTASGPAAGHRLFQTGYDPSGLHLLGTANNCAHGVTPWGTYVTCEENANGYFHRNGAETADQAALLDRYGYSATGFGYRWATTDPRFNTGVEPNEPNRFHWVVEIDPFDPTSTPVKRTALGRFKHESAAVTTARNNRVVVYSGDDERFDHIYKFVGNRPWQSYQHGTSPLDDGTLYTAVFHEDGAGHWEPLTLGNPALAGAFADMGELLVKTRMAADMVGATRMDRPEWIAVDPRTCDVYCTCTNNSRRTTPDPMNPVAPNFNGHIIRWTEAGGDNGALTFDWDVLLVAGEHPYDPDGVQNVSDVGFGSPDGLWFDPDGRLWIQTDGGQPIDSNDQMLAIDPDTGDLRRFLVGVPECEVTGMVMTPDQRTLFVNIQHPGDDGGSDWPDQVGGLPRAATVVVTKDDGGVIGT